MRKWWMSVVTFSLAVTVTTATAAALSNDGGPAVGDGQPPGGSGTWNENVHRPNGIDGVGAAPCSPFQLPEECTYGYTPYFKPGWAEPHGNGDAGWGWAVPGQITVVYPIHGGSTPGYSPDPERPTTWPVDPDGYQYRPNCESLDCEQIEAESTETAIEAARKDLAMRLGTEAASIEALTAERVDWADGSLGNPQPGYAYTQAIVPGYLIRLEAMGAVYVYHTDMRGNVTMVSGT